MSMPAVSIIMPCYNCAGTLRRGVDAALNQTFADFELLIIDDGSNDNSRELARELSRDPRVVPVPLDQNRGVSAARNHGIEQARGEYLAFLDADDTWDPDFLTKMMAALSSAPEAVLAYCGWQNTGVSGGPGDPYVPPDYDQERKRYHLLKSCPWPIHAALTRTAAIRAAGGFDPEHVTSEDYWLWVNLVIHTPIVRVPEVLCYYHFHPQQATGDRARIAINRYAVQQELLDRFPILEDELTASERKELTSGQLLYDAYDALWHGDSAVAHQLFRHAWKLGLIERAHLKHLLIARLLPRSLYCRLMSRAGAPSS